MPAPRSPLPGPASRALIERLRRTVVVEPYPFAIDLERSRGLQLVTVDGDALTDWAGGYGSRLLGYNPPDLQDPAYLRHLALAAANKLPNPDVVSPECVAYYELLHRLAPPCLRGPGLEVYVVNSGAEAVENLMKYFLNLHARKMEARGRRPAARRFVYFDQAFHGRTVFALTITRLEQDPIVTKDFQGIVPGNVQVPFPAVDTDRPRAENLQRTAQSLAIVERVLQQYGDEIVGVVVEPLQGAGGHRVALPEFFQGLSRLAERFDVYLGFDEVQTAGGPTGTVFAVEGLELPFPPQAVAVAKKFANGAVYMRHPMDDRGVLDSTWGGNLADMVRFVAEWRVVEARSLVAAVAEKERALTGVLRGLAERFPGRVANVRGLGLYQGFTLPEPGARARLLERALADEGLWLLGAGTDSVRLRPPLDVTLEDIADLGERLGRLLA